MPPPCCLLTLRYPSYLPPFSTCHWWSVSKSIQSSDHTRTSRDHLKLQTRHVQGSPFHAPQRDHVCSHLHSQRLWIQPSLFSLFISGCLLAGCCLLVAAGGTLDAAHSWSFVLRGAFIMREESFPCAPRHLSQGHSSISQLNTILSPSALTFIIIIIISFFLSPLTGAAFF